MPMLDVRMADVIRMRRPPPCGGFEWEVVRVGADIGLRCLTCGHRVLVRRSAVERDIKGFVERPLAPAD